MEILLTNPRGFCAGVDRAIDIVRRALEMFDEPIYVRHEVVHNTQVVNELKAEGVIFIEDLNTVPDESILIYSAHGVSQDIRQQARRKSLRVFDATCPLVTKVHMEVLRFCKKKYSIILIGHAGHPEVEGTLGQFFGDGEIQLVQNADEAESVQVKTPQRLAYVTQTTLSVDETAEVVAVLERRFPEMKTLSKQDICYATSNRQEAVKSLTAQCELILVVGSHNSSNSNRLVELARKRGRKSWLIDSTDDIDHSWFDGVSRIGISAGASAPESLVQSVVAYLRSHFQVASVAEEGEKEDITFSLPGPLRFSKPAPPRPPTHTG
ncbi:MAG: 4-hydroxy-3-methylbut-2-enyl diphosphate reductase [Gammaproteobacteria bacterium]|nr:4-hydroxy-3-methylbut-2-enyl diphosphate reductase [Gammaproteobacteria bacterium]